jgi:hypothetical protein
MPTHQVFVYDVKKKRINNNWCVLNENESYAKSNIGSERILSIWVETIIEFAYIWLNINIKWIMDAHIEWMKYENNFKQKNLIKRTSPKWILEKTFGWKKYWEK